MSSSARALEVLLHAASPLNKEEIGWQLRSSAFSWVSPHLVSTYEEERRKLAIRREPRPKDPRDARFYELANMSKKRRTKDDLVELIRYCEAMVDHVKNPKDDTALKAWEQERIRLQALLNP